MSTRPTRRSTKKPSLPSSSSSAPPPSEIPTPFTRASQHLLPFLERLDPAQVHIIHIDRHPARQKRQIFLIPVILNAFIAALLLWRAFHAIPHYLVLLRTFFGQTTAATVDTAATTRRQQVLILGKRVVGMFADFLLFRFVGPWPVTFFFEQPVSPCLWRWRLGFRPEEVVVRVSRGWGTADLMEGVKSGKENAFFKNRVLPAIDPAHMLKTGYLMMDKDWDLEFELMLDAHTLVERGTFGIEEVDKLVLAFHEGDGWIAWRWEDVDDAVETRRKQVVKFKDKLTTMGKESLFWKWTEIVEEERDLDGGFSTEGQFKVAKRVQAEFEKEGVDFEKLAQSIGGLAEIPSTSK